MKRNRHHVLLRLAQPTLSQCVSHMHVRQLRDVFERRFHLHGGGDGGHPMRGHPSEEDPQSARAGGIAGDGLAFYDTSWGERIVAGGAFLERAVVPTVLVVTLTPGERGKQLGKRGQSAKGKYEV